jgi:hypothetical protein
MKPQRYRISAYATSPSFHRWDGELERQYFSGLAADPRVIGIEHPFFDDGGQHCPVEWLAEHLPASWDLAITALPGMMRHARTQSQFGLASVHEPSRQAAVAMVERLRRYVDDLHACLGRTVVRHLHLHSAPSGSLAERRGSAQAFERSMREVQAMHWDDIGLLIEHCDAPVPGHAPEKGFLPLEAELDIAQRLGLGILLNWGRSAIEARSVRGPLTHLEAVIAAGRLGGFCFSGCASADNPDYGAWRDTHMPATPVVASPWLREDSLLSERAIGETLAQLRRAQPLAELGVKVLDPAPDPNVARKVGLNLDTLAAIDAVHRHGAARSPAALAG